MTSRDDNPLRRLPAVDRLLEDPRTAELADGLPRRIVVDALRRTLDDTRRQLLASPETAPDDQALGQMIFDRLAHEVDHAARCHYRKAVNATGIILHTGLGRAVLPRQAIDQIERELTGYSVLQLSPETGKRSRRDQRIEWLLQQLTGAEAATVVNNNSAATAIVLNTVASGREVIVSRGQLVEIGGSFRLPDVMRTSGARMVEVGCTNKTHLRDYAEAINENTTAILRVHPSNYQITGFSQEVPLAPLVELARKHNLVMIDDVGAGALVDMSAYGFEKEPTLPESIATGADLTVSSADKLIGASQGGIILGRADLVEAVRKNPWARIVRVGKLTLATLEATLMLFLDEQDALQHVPTLRMVQRSLDELTACAEQLAKR
ncbi:MAG: L-seryl-tRNA(Sec) selenium transferase, partial [Planctomycetota bacterium]